MIFFVEKERIKKLDPNPGPDPLFTQTDPYQNETGPKHWVQE